MTDFALPTTVRDFICDRIHAIEQLEVLMLLHADRAEAWTAKAAADALQTDESFAKAALEHLRVQGLLLAGGGKETSYKFAPVDVELEQRVNETVAAYRVSRLEILKLISQCAMDRIRTAHVRAFASAFLFRSPPKKDRA